VLAAVLAGDADVKTIIVTGWRGATQEKDGPQIVHRLAVCATQLGGGRIRLRHGACPYGGVDEIAAEWAEREGHEVVAYPAEIRNGRVQGPARNRAMCAAGGNLMVAFPAPESRGTLDAMQWAVRYGITIRVWPLYTQHTLRGELGVR
jgi:hypothetical protein